jgi:hypothetical protein
MIIRRTGQDPYLPPDDLDRPDGWERHRGSYERGIFPEPERKPKPATKPAKQERVGRPYVKKVGHWVLDPNKKSSGKRKGRGQVCDLCGAKWGRKPRRPSCSHTEEEWEAFYARRRSELGIGNMVERRRDDEKGLAANSPGMAGPHLAHRIRQLARRGIDVDVDGLPPEMISGVVEAADAERRAQIKELLSRPVANADEHMALIMELAGLEEEPTNDAYEGEVVPSDAGREATFAELIAQAEKEIADEKGLTRTHGGRRGPVHDDYSADFTELRPKGFPDWKEKGDLSVFRQVKMKDGTTARLEYWGGEGNKKKRGRPRKWKDDAEKNRAHRRRKKDGAAKE